MRKKNVLLLIGCFLFLNSTLSAQKLKIKKGEILMDNTCVGHISKSNDLYTYAASDGKPVFSAEQTSKTKSGVETPETWLRIYSPDQKLSCEIEQPSGRFTLSAQKAITFMLMDSKPQLLSESGLNVELIGKLLQEGKCAFSSRWDSINKVTTEEVKLADKLAKENGLSISPQGDVKLHDKKVGRIVCSKNEYQQKSYAVYDNVGNKIADLNSGAIQYCPNLVSVMTFDKKSFPIKRSLMHSQLDMDPTASAIVARLLAAGYKLGDMTKTISEWRDRKSVAAEKQEEAELQQAVDKARSQSVNIYNVPCTVHFTDGQVEKGNLTLLFESLDDKSNNGIVDLNTYGRVATLNTGGSMGKLTLKAKDGYILDMGDRKFIGCKGLGDNVLSYVRAGDAMLGVTKPAQFFEILFDDGHENYILQHPLDSGELLLLLKDKKEALYVGNKGLLGTRSSKKIASALAKYINCPNIDTTLYDTLKQEGLKKLIADYREKCQK